MINSQRFTKLSVALLLGLAVAGCTMNHTSGVVTMKIDEKTARVCVRKAEARVGDRMALYRIECARIRLPRSHMHCEATLVGEGTITSLLNEHYALLEFDKPTDFSEGDVVDKVGQ